MKRYRKILLGLLAAIGLGTAAVALAQPVIAEMKLFFFDKYVRISYDADPNVAGTTTVMEIDGDDAQVNVTGLVNATNGFGATYSEDFASGDIAAAPAALYIATSGAVYSASAGQLDMIWFNYGRRLIFAQITAQTIGPVMDATGLDISGDQVAAETVELFAGGALGTSGRPMVIGVDPAFYFCAGVTLADASGINPLLVGWRTATQTPQGTYTTYLNYATIGAVGTADPNTIFIKTGNDDTDVSTDTTQTWADAANKRLCVFVDAAGAVTYTNNGSAPTVTAAYSFDDGDSVIPFILSVQAADLSGAVDVTEWTVGYTTAGRN